MIFPEVCNWRQQLTQIIWVGVLICQCQGEQHHVYFRRQDSCPGQALSEDRCPVSVRTKGKAECAAQCGQRTGCLSFVWDPLSSACQLCDTVVTLECNNTRPAPGLAVFEMGCPDRRQPVNGMCQCHRAFRGLRCQNRMNDCKDWQAAGYTGNNVRWIYPVLSSQPFPIMCQLKWGRGLAMYRNTSSVDFYRNWTQYAEGFGDMAGDYWLGLHKLHLLTHSRCYNLWFQFNLANTTYYQRLYRKFTVSGESEQFTLNFSSFSAWNNKLGDCLSDVRLKPFSTYDVDHDDNPTGSCAKRHHSAWWFGNCTLCNPTGELTQPADMTRTSDREVFWEPGLGDLVPERVMMMLVRC